MFDGFGLFGTGIGTGFFGKLEDFALGAGCALSNAKREVENARLEGRKRKGEPTEQEEAEEYLETEEGDLADVP